MDLQNSTFHRVRVFHPSLHIVSYVLEARTRNADNKAKIYELLLPASEEIRIPLETMEVSGQRPSTNLDISVSILQTCKQINEEATPILYNKNTFTICLRISPRQLIFQVC